MNIVDLPRQLYTHPHVRRGILDFLGASRGKPPTCRFITADTYEAADLQPRAVSELDQCLGQGMGIARSLWDRERFVADLDIEYVNFDFAAEPYLREDRIFGLQEPVVRVVRALLREYGIKPLHLYSGRGHHFIWSISQDSQALDSLVEIGTHHGGRGTVQVFDGEPVPTVLSLAFDGIALVMEFLAHEIKHVSAAVAQVPVEITAVEVGPGECGREMISIDISEYGDPLQTRAIRVPFTLYCKPWQQQEQMGAAAMQEVRPIIITPLPPVEHFGGFELLHDAVSAARTARCVATSIPICDEAMENLISSYRGSTLHHFHEFFYSREQLHKGEWKRIYGEDPLAALPPCARLVLEHPNDLLLKPWGFRLVTRSLLALGWHPRHISGLILTKFIEDHGWGDRWMGYDPAMRADFYTRIFSGLFMTRRDDLIDLNCQSSKEERTCLVDDCPINLAWYRESALARRRYGHLADRPLNRLFLPKEHL